MVEKAINSPQLTSITEEDDGEEINIRRKTVKVDGTAFQPSLQTEQDRKKAARGTRETMRATLAMLENLKRANPHVILSPINIKIDEEETALPTQQQEDCGAAADPRQSSTHLYSLTEVSARPEKLTCKDVF
ncbi:hypothetical protein E2C01_032014 [Portunus trituberculatus]|uniref:Uncharacterized protein n=1 Tax=Portunus trituberculatus TaxID=210409 RepID=A0A5B7EZF3_PORTR|nr:hypothetical protein [Portunus trituberculatus]